MPDETMDLLPCPFCGAGGEALGFTSSAADNAYVFCECGGEGPAGENENDAAHLWNTRAEKN